MGDFDCTATTTATSAYYNDSFDYETAVNGTADPTVLTAEEEAGMCLDRSATDKMFASNIYPSGLYWNYQPAQATTDSVCPISTLDVGDILAWNSLDQTQIVTLNDPHYGGTEKTYEGYSLEDILSQFPNREQYNTITFKCADGYTANIPLDERLKGGILAVRDLSIPMSYPDGEEPHETWTGLWPKSNGKLRKGNPGPAYLIWPKGTAYDSNSFNWPYQVVSIELSYQTDVKTMDPETAAGFKIFKKNCSQCHTTPDLKGGNKGPHLAMRKRTVGMDLSSLEKFIRHNDQKSVMPSFEALSPDDIRKIATYVQKIPQQDSDNTDK